MERPKIKVGATLDTNAYLMAKHRALKTVRGFNEKVMPLLKEFNLTSSEDIRTVWEKLNDETVSLKWLIDYALAKNPVHGLSETMHRKLLDESLFNHVALYFPSWKRWTEDDHGKPLERITPSLFTPTDAKTAKHITVDKEGLHLNEDTLMEEYLYTPTDKQLELLEKAADLCAMADEMGLDLMRLFMVTGGYARYRKFTPDPRAFFRFSNYCLLD